MIFDTHAHLNDDAFAEDKEAIIAALAQNGIGACCIVGWDLPSSAAALKLAQDDPCLYAAVGVSPQHAAVLTEAELSALEAMLADERCVALGEIGLDYHWEPYCKETQLSCLHSQSALARAKDIPISYHVRDAWGDFLAYLKEVGPHRGIMHCFSGNAETARECLDAGLMISFSGSVSFKNARKLKEAAKYVPLDRLLIETDCPYLSPEPLRGRRNQPAHIVHTAAAVAAIREMEEEALRQATWENACRLFGVAP